MSSRISRKTPVICGLTSGQKRAGHKNTQTNISGLGIEAGKPFVQINSEIKLLYSEIFFCGRDYSFSSVHFHSFSPVKS